jgi:hypothetical protein
MKPKNIDHETQKYRKIAIMKPKNIEKYRSCNPKRLKNIDHETQKYRKISISNFKHYLKYMSMWNSMLRSSTLGNAITCICKIEGRLRDCNSNSSDKDCHLGDFVVL